MWVEASVRAGVCKEEGDIRGDECVPAGGYGFMLALSVCVAVSVCDCVCV